jgi:transcriptional regulator with XRE-family HTH domain
MDERNAATELADLLRGMKQRSSCSYEELARRTFVSSSTLHRYCTGRSVPPETAVISRIAKACGASSRELHQVLEVWLVVDRRRLEGESTVSAPDAGGVRPVEEPAVAAAKVTGPRRRLPMFVILALPLVLIAATTSAGVAPPMMNDAARPQWVMGPSWVRVPTPVKSTTFGVTVASDLGAMPAFKVGAVRFWDSDTRWASIQPRRGVFDWTTLDRLVAGANHAGLPALFVIGGTPGWAAPAARKAPYTDGSRAAAPDDLRDWDNFVRALVRRFHGRIEAYELWALGNDPRFFAGSTETLVEMTRRAGRIITAGDPKATVVCPGMGRLWRPEGRRVLQRFAELGGFQYCDVASIKLFQRDAADPPETMLDVLQAVNDAMHREGVAPPLWSTGTTYDITLQNRLSAQQAINYAVRFYLTGLYGTELNLRRMYFYSWGNAKIPLVLQAEEGAPTRAALAVEVLQHWLAQARIRACGHGLSLGLPANVWQCDFVIADSGGSHSALIRWTHRGTATTVAPPGARAVRRLDGSETPVDPGDAIQAGERPVLVEYRDAQGVASGGPAR